MLLLLLLLLLLFLLLSAEPPIKAVRGGVGDDEVRVGGVRVVVVCGGRLVGEVRLAGRVGVGRREGGRCIGVGGGGAGGLSRA